MHLFVLFSGDFFRIQRSRDRANAFIIISNGVVSFFFFLLFVVLFEVVVVMLHSKNRVA